MRLFLFILLAGFAVSDDNNYYVVQLQDPPPSPFLHDPLILSKNKPTDKKPFHVYWNVPTMQCASKKIHFKNLFEDFGIIQNDNDRFKGEKITILYDPGLFPALFKNETGGKLRFRNGGVPQEGNLNKHLEEFIKELDRSIPDKDFDGIGIIDFESWRPQFRQNFNELKAYKEVSFEIERKLHWWWKEPWIKEEAKRRFEESGRSFMESTLTVAKRLRPKSRWGFYGFPYCFNMASNNKKESCAAGVPRENDEIPWLWRESTALYPSVYSPSTLNTWELQALIRGRLREAARCAGEGKDILPYFWFRYRDDGFLSQPDLSAALSTLYKSAATGVIIWGSSNDVNTVDKCSKLKTYVEETFGPAIAKYTKPIVRDQEIDEFTTNIPDVSLENILNTNTDLTLRPVSNWTSPEPFTQDIKDTNESDNKTLVHNITLENKLPVLVNNSILIDVLLSSVLNSDNETKTTENPKIKYNKISQIQNEFLVSKEEGNISSSTESSQVTNSVVTSNPLEITTNYTKTEIINLITTEVATSTDCDIYNETTTETSEFDDEKTEETNTYVRLDEENGSPVNETSSTANSEQTYNDYDLAPEEDDDDIFSSDPFLLFSSRDPTITTEDYTFNSATDEDFTKSTNYHQNFSEEMFNYIDAASTQKVTETSTTDNNYTTEVSTEFPDVEFAENNDTYTDEEIEYFTEASSTSTDRISNDLFGNETFSTNTDYGIETTSESFSSQSNTNIDENFTESTENEFSSSVSSTNSDTDMTDVYFSTETTNVEFDTSSDTSLETVSNASERSSTTLTDSEWATEDFTSLVSSTEQVDEH